ncbi:MAG: hypothetical protein Q9168_008212 [Polycauliona sp. 1 TL-2023]
MSLILSFLAALLLLLGHFSTDAKPVFQKGPGRNNHRLPNNNNDHHTIISRAAPPGSQATPTFTSKTDITSLKERALVKRGQCVSRDKNTYQCSSTTPSVADCVNQITSHGNVGAKTSVFYSGLGGRVGLTACKQFFSCHPGIGPIVLFDEIVDEKWLEAQADAIAKGNQAANPMTVNDPFMKRLSQAFAEASKGDAYICTPESNAPNNDFNQDLAWGGWEYPALTRNGDVNRIVRVDPGTGVTRDIWKKGDPATPNEPKG